MSSTEVPATARFFESASGEYDDILIEDITGILPDELSGTLYRNGPVRWDAGGFYAQHLFDGDGMVSKFVLDKGQLRYRNRFVRTPAYLAEQAGHGRSVKGVGNLRSGGPLANAGRVVPADRGNTHAVFHANKLTAHNFDGRPWNIDPDSLDTLGSYDYDGKLSRLSPFSLSPHPKIDPNSGDMFNFGVTVNTIPRPGALGLLLCYRIDTEGRLTTIAKVPLDHLRIGHDFGLTEKYVVFVLDPLILTKPVPVALGLIDANAGTEFCQDLGSIVILVPRDGGKPRRFVMPAIPKVHVNNAYDDGDDSVIDVVRYSEWDEIAPLLRNFRDYDQIRGGTLTRLGITKNNRTTLEDLCPLLGEFPTHDWRYTTRNYRHSYLVNLDGSSNPQILKIDNHSGAQTAFAGFTQGDFPGEPIFVPRHRHAAEDDGWLLLIAYLAAEHRTALYILDARDLESEPVAVAGLPHHFMPGFHGMFTDRVSPPVGQK